MGIDTLWRNKILNSPDACGHAFIEKQSFKPENGVMIFDLFTDIYSLFNPASKNTSFTGAEFYRAVCRVVLRPLQAGTCHTVVVCLDDGDRVPQEKKREQKSRDNKSTVDKLPETTEFTDEGAVFYQGGGAHRFNIRAAMATRSLRPRLFQYLMHCFKSHLTLPPNQTLILDYEPGGVWVLSKGQWGRDATSAHEYGEADLSVLYWLNRLWLSNRPSNFYIRSTDSDQIPILLNFLTHRYANPSTSRQKLYIRYWRGKTAERWMNMRAVYRWITTKLGWSISAFVSACCLTGTDFTDPNVTHAKESQPRRLLFNKISVPTVFEACQKFNMPLELEKASTSLRSFVYAVRSVYTHVFTNATGRLTSCLGIPKEVREHWQKKLARYQRSRGGKDVPFRLEVLRTIPPNPSIVIPTDDQLMEVFGQLQFNLRYWMIDLSKMEVTRPERGVPLVEQLEETQLAGGMDIPLLQDPVAVGEKRVSSEALAEESPQKKRKI